MSLTRELLAPLLALDPAELDDAVVASVRQLWVDHVGVCARGSQTPGAGAVRDLVVAQGHHGGPRLPLVGTRADAPAPNAALANAAAAHSIEYDDVHNGSSTHPGVVVFPAVLASSALGGLDEARFLAGIVVGYEVLCRVGRAATPIAQYERHFHPTGTCGHLGAAAAAAVVLGLDLDAATSALGIAASLAGGGMRFAADGSWSKPLNPGHAVRAGVEAALLARAGFDGGPDGIAGARGFLETFSDGLRPGELLAERPLEVCATSVKAHTCCRYKQGPIDALLEIRATHGLRAAEVEAVEIGMLSAGMDIVALPVEVKRAPRNLIDAQFSMPFGAAVSLLDGRADLDQYDTGRLGDPELQGLMQRVVCVTDPQLDESYPDRWAAWARVRTRDGRTLEARIDHPKGDPPNPLSVSELHAKFESLTEPIYTRRRQQQLLAELERLPAPGCLKRVLELVPTDRPT